MKKRFRFRFGLRARFTCFFILFGIGVLFVTVGDLAPIIDNVFQKHYTETLRDIAEITGRNFGLSPEEIRSYASSCTADETYEKALEQLQTIRGVCQLTSCYVIYPTGPDTAIWFADASESDVKKLGDPVENYADIESAQFREVYTTGEMSRSLDVTGEGTEDEVISIYFPMKDELGNVVAVLGVDKKFTEASEGMDETLARIAGLIFVEVVIEVLGLTLFVRFGVISAIGRLKRGVQRMENGELGVQIACRRRDEIGEITEIFNRMSVSISRHIAEMEELNHAYRRFIPFEIFEILGKKSIVDLRLGDHANIDPTVLWMEPKNAKRILPDLTSQEMFSYINRMLSGTVPAAIGQGGAVWHLEKAGVCSFFHNGAKRALDAALAAGRNLSKEGEALAAGIAQGSVMVGIAGHEERADIVSISRQAQAAMFLMEIGERFHASVLIEKSVAAQIPEFESSYHTRFLGYIRIAATKRLEGVYDVYDGDSDADRQLKRRTRERFEQGVGLFTKQDYAGAREAFIDVLRQYRRDGAAREYLYLCGRALEEADFGGQVWFTEMKKGND